MSDFKIVKLMGSIFTPKLAIMEPIKWLSVTTELLGDRIGRKPTVLDLPQDAPPEIPRIQFIAPDRGWRLTISNVRTDLAFLYPRMSDEFRINTTEFARVASGFLSALQKRLEIKIQRLAFVTERLFPEENPAAYIYKKYCTEKHYQKNQLFHNARKFEIHSLKNYHWEGFHLNSWVRIKSIRFHPEDQDSVSAVFVENDLNTLSAQEDPDRLFSEEETSKFFTMAPQELQGILIKYFPEKEG